MRRIIVIVALLITAGCQSRAEHAEVRSEANPKRDPDTMPPRLVASAVTKEKLKVGTETVVQSDSPIGRYQAVFEDDGETGYFYALDSNRPDNPIVDALHIYNVKSVTDRDNPSQLHVVWSADGLKVGLFINSYPHAVYNFESNCGCCRTGFPPPADATLSHNWDESLMVHFHDNEGG